MNVSTDVLAVLSSVQITGAQLTIVGQLDRKLYEKTNKVLEAAGGKWNRKAKAHVFDDDPSDLIDHVLLTGAITSARDEFGFFPSPPEVVDAVIERAQLERGHRVLEPSAGHGALAVGAAASGSQIYCIELLPRNVAVLRGLQEICPRIETVLEGDFLSLKPERVYDRVVMNPPFARQADIRHVLHAHQWLKPGGLLVAVMAAGVTFRQDRLSSDFRALVDARGGSIDPLPEGAFKASGTSVRTVVVTIPGGAP
jgi:predicted RNA methylase